MYVFIFMHKLCLAFTVYGLTRLKDIMEKGDVYTGGLLITTEHLLRDL